MAGESACEGDAGRAFETDDVEASPDRGESACEDDAGRALTWSEAETMSILADPDSMRLLAESDAEMRAGRVSVWKPEDM